MSEQPEQFEDEDGSGAEIWEPSSRCKAPEKVPEFDALLTDEDRRWALAMHVSLGDPGGSPAAG
jgi:hypothetical protein